MHNDTKQKILQAAQSLFAEKGYAASSMESLAGAVNINKATIYHHFKSKQDILIALVDELISDTISLHRQVKAETATKEKTARRSEDKRYRFISDRKNIFSVIMLEMLKSGNKEDYLFKYIDTTLGRALKQNELSKPESFFLTPPLLTKSLFFGILPTIMYILLKDKFIAHYQFAEEQVEEAFFEALDGTAESLRKELR